MRLHRETDVGIIEPANSSCYGGVIIHYDMEQTLAANLKSTIDIKCKACGAMNPVGALFCLRCTAPQNVLALSDLSASDQRVCLSSLFEVLAYTLRSPAPAQSSQHDLDLWRAYLSAFWLRPETALILYAEAMAIRSVAAIPGNSWLDLGCGDGVHAALYSGWRFDPEFDVFQSLDLSAADIYHHWNAGQFIALKTASGTPIEHGIDIKSTAVSRATALNVFNHVQQGDATHLPVEDGSLSTIFSNMLRDLGEPLAKALAECRRVLTGDGQLLISAMTPAYSRHLHFAPAALEAEARGDTNRSRQLLRLDRGRSLFCQRQLSIDAWQALLAEQGLKLKSVIPIVGPAIIRFWDVGLRPFSILLLKQRQAWSDVGLLRLVKPAMVDLLATSLEPLLQQLTDGEPCMNLLVVVKA